MDDNEVKAVLFEAVKHRNETLLEDLLSNGSGSHLLDVPCEDGNTLLHVSVIDNNVRCVECLLKSGADPNRFDANRARTPLHLAVELGLDEIVKIFLELGHVNLELRDDRNLTCLEIAQFCDNQRLVDLISERQSDIDHFRHDFYTVMNQACTSNDPKLVKTLLDSFEQRIVNKLPKGWQPHKDGRSFARSSLREMINWSSSSWDDVTLLFKSASKGHTEVCRILIDFGATAKCNENTNYSPLYVAAYGGYTETVKLLLDSFPSLIQEVTIEKWTVLHACCLQGHSETANLILNYPYPEPLRRRYVSRSGLYEYHFSFNLNAQDAAGQTVIYLAVCANNERLLDTLLNFKIEACCIQTNKQADPSRQPNSGDPKYGRSINQARVIPDRLRARQTHESSSCEQTNQLDKILAQLQRLKTKNTGQNLSNDYKIQTKEDGLDKIQVSDTYKYLICPFEMDTYCDYNSKTALHLAVCQQHHNIATTLLVNGSNPNLPILFRDSMSKSGDYSNFGANNPNRDSPVDSGGVDIGLNWLRSSKSTCLKEACRLNDSSMCEILIRYGARDNQDNLALQVAAANKNNQLISMFLTLKSNIDAESKINRKCNVEFASRYKQNQRLIQGGSSANATTFSSMFPSTPVTIDWRNLRCIKQIDPQWLINASLQHNKRLRHPTNSLMAITRLDLSCNNLKIAHPVIFRLPSLRELNLSSNRLESLGDFAYSYHHRTSNDSDLTPTSKLIESHRTAMKRSKSSNVSSVNLESSNLIDLNEPQEWDLPYLETLDLHDNLLISLPDCLFELPKLSELDVSSNQLRQLPWAIWTAPALRELVASGNLLDDLPKTPPPSRLGDSQSSGTQPNQLHIIRDSPEVGDEQRHSLGSNHSQDKSHDKSTASDQLFDSSIVSEDKLLLADAMEFSIKLSESKLDRVNHWSKRVEVIGGSAIQAYGQESAALDASLIDASCNYSSSAANLEQFCKINYMNLSHNSFASIPPVLACVATNLLRLNMSHNCLKSMGDIGLLPARLKSLDLSNNQICEWFHQQNDDAKHCFVENLAQFHSTKQSVPQFRTLTPRGYANLYCTHKMHQSLDNLKSLNLSRNELTRIELTQERLEMTASSTSLLNSTSSSRLSSRRDSHASSASGGATSPAPMKTLLAFPNLTAFDLSFNKIDRVPDTLSSLKDLSVLNLSGNVSISSLPPELGLASKLWNLGVNGCNLSEPLKSIVESKTYKTMDIIGYLRSILEESKPYARMKLMLVGLQGIGKTSLLEQMRHEGSSGLNTRRRAPEHWTKRMGHASKSNLKNQRGVNLSTVGIDIHDWVYQKRTTRDQPNYGPVSFSTWDFGGQEEFYATHRYFLSKRSMYLVVWRITDGLDGILAIQQWLVNIQSRAPNSPVIIVATHEDMIEGGERGARAQALQAQVFKRFVNVSDQDKCGLPKVVDSIIVSTKTKLNIKNLCNRIYDVVFSLRCPGSTEKLLSQKIPATYLYLEEIVSALVHERQQCKREPVLTYDEFRKLVSERLKLKYNKEFRDLEPLNSREINHNSELQQATRFLHENGVLLHYEDSNLRDLYFLDPQWLCDILSHVVTIREINPHVKNGMMKVDDLSHLFKSMDVQVSGGVQSYVVNLLNKFEVALTWNSQYLLIPSLLPKEPEALLLNNQSKQMAIGETNEPGERLQLKVQPRMRGRSAVRRPVFGESSNGPNTSARATSIDPSRRRMLEARHRNKGDQIYKHFYEFEYSPADRLIRLVLLRYLPAGFLARLQASVLSEASFDEICEHLQLDLLNRIPQRNDELLEELVSVVGNKPGWLCWKAGIRLNLQKEATINWLNKGNDILEPPCLLSIQEFSSLSDQFAAEKLNLQVECLELGQAPEEQPLTKPSSGMKIKTRKWNELDHSQYSNILMISVPNAKLRVTNKEDRSMSFALDFSQLNVARLLARAVDHIDDLLEDWYPSLGARFAHTLGGDYLVTRVVPCPSCAEPLIAVPRAKDNRGRDGVRASNIGRTARAVNQVKFSIRSAADNAAGSQFEEAQSKDSVHCFYVEHCILAAYNLDSSNLAHRNQQQQQQQQQKSRFNLNLFGGNQSAVDRRKVAAQSCCLTCPKHGSISLARVAPDITFDDIGDELKLGDEQIDRCKLIGRGLLGFVFKASLHSSFPMNQLGLANQEVALKVLQPVEPGPDAQQADVVAYNSARTNWSREPFQCACRSYCSARHEINILAGLSHPNIVQFMGLCLRPLAIVLELAPLGSLEEIFKGFKRAGARIDQSCAQKTIMQIARALEFLHQHRVIYRDLKTENVLVWSFASPFATEPARANVELKLADYGISRQALSTGIWKGFAGTINFLAPEILRHNGDEEYTEKVDCFSFGMLMYELLTLRPPFKQQQQRQLNERHQKPAEPSCRGYLSELGARPSLTVRDLIYPNYFVDLMSLCWSQEPHDRPTASQIVSIVSSPEFMQVVDVAAVGTSTPLAHSCAVQTSVSGHIDLWCFSSQNGTNSISIFGARAGQWTSCEVLDVDECSSGALESNQQSELLLTASITASCVIGTSVCFFDSAHSLVHAFPMANSAKTNWQTTSTGGGGSQLSHIDQAPDATSGQRFKTFPIDFNQANNLDTSELSSCSVIKCMLAVPNSDCLLLLLAENGQLWLCSLGQSMACTRLDAANLHFSCVALQDGESDDQTESCSNNQQKTESRDETESEQNSSGPPQGSFMIFCGQSNGISCLEVSFDSLTVKRQSILPLASARKLDLSGEQIVELSQTTEVSSIVASREHVWTAAGCTVHLWSQQERHVIRKLDCWKLVPCSESLESINIEQYYEQARSSVITSLARVKGQLFASTSHGCFIVIEAGTLKPVIVFRPFESDMIILQPKVCPKFAKSNSVKACSDHLMTVGRGHRDLMSRYLSSSSIGQESLCVPVSKEELFVATFSAQSSHHTS